jgi:hypothetical protein
MRGSIGVLGERVMFQSVRPSRHLWVHLRLVTLTVALALLGGCTLESALGQTAGLQLAAPAGETHAYRAQMMPSLSSSRLPTDHCRPPTSLCGATLKALEQGAFLDFRASPQGERPTPRLLSPFAVVHIDPLDRGRCPPKLCAAHVALAGVLEELLREGYHTQSVALFPGSAVVTVRTERIDRSLNILKGSCRFNLDPKCVDFNVWLQEDQRSGEPCGFAQTRVLVAAATAPDFVGAASFTPADASPIAGVEALRLAAFDAAAVRVYALLYVHKICRNEMVLVRNG